MAAVSKILTYGIERTKTLSAGAAKEVLGVAKIPSDIRLGYQCGKRLSEIKKAGSRKTAGNIGTGMLRKGVVDHLPGIMAGLGTAAPIIGTGALGLVIGKFMQRVIRRILI